MVEIQGFFHSVSRLLHAAQPSPDVHSSCHSPWTRLCSALRAFHRAEEGVSRDVIALSWCTGRVGAARVRGRGSLELRAARSSPPTTLLLRQGWEGFHSQPWPSGWTQEPALQ